MPDQNNLTKPVVHIYLTKTVDYEYFRLENAKIGILTAAEQGRFERYKKRNDAQNFLIARCILRQRLSDLLSCSPIDVPILISSAGKPYLDTLSVNNNVAFSVAHCNDHVAVALVYGDHTADFRGIGIDLEDLNRIQNPKVSARKFINAHVHDKLINLSNDHARLRFMQYWTCLEAYVKCLGSTIAKERAEFDIDILALEQDQPIQSWNGVKFVSCRYSTVVLSCACDFDVKPCELNYWRHLDGQFCRVQLNPVV